MTRIIAVASGKGGVGKTTSAINLGCALAGFGHDVLIIDANLATPHVALHLGSPHLPHTLNEALCGAKDIKETSFIHPAGFRIIPASLSSGADDLRRLKGLKALLADIDGTCDIVLLDAPAGVLSHTGHVLSAADELVVGTTPDLPAITDALKTIRLAEERGCPVLGFILNQTGIDRSEMSEKNVEAMLGCQKLGVIPSDVLVRRSLAQRQPVVYLYPDAPSSVGFKKAAAYLIGEPYEERQPTAPTTETSWANEKTFGGVATKLRAFFER